MLAAHGRRTAFPALPLPRTPVPHGTHGRLTLEPVLRDIPDTASATLRSGDGMSVRIQLLSARQSPVAIGASSVGAALQRRAPSRAGRSDTARLHRVEDRNVGRSPRISRSVGSVGAQQNRGDQRHGGGSVSAIRTYRQGLCVFVEVTPQQTEELGFPQSGSDRQSDRVVFLTCSRNALLEESRKSRRDSLRAISNALTPTNTLSRRQR
ncbi:MAG: hypothetical protein JWR37_3787 [Mycobacterium sp.]|nr:hypothetical protein [Mycobacterium sp.]